MDKAYEDEIRTTVRHAVTFYATAFQDRHIAEVDNAEGTINSKVHNIFIAALGDEVRFYSALVRSLDSSLGNFIEKMAIVLAEKNFIVTQNVEGPLYREQTLAIAELLEDYKTRRRRPSVADYQDLRQMISGGGTSKRHDSDYMLQNKKTKEYALIELKLGGDLDNKKARSEKEALLEQFCILSNTQGAAAKVTMHFATGYNSYGEGNPWRQERVKQFFADDELLISSAFWNFIVQDSRGFEVVIDEYRSCAHLISDALDKLKAAYVK